MKKLLIVLIISLVAVYSTTAVLVQVNDVPAIITDLIVTLTGIFTPSAAQAITAVTDAILANATIIEVNPDANHTLTSTPHIANGTEGQIIILTADPAEANTVTLQDQGTLAGTNVLLLNSIASRAIGASSSIALRFDGADWREIWYNGSLDISTDTNLTVTAPITLTDDDIGITVAKDLVTTAPITGGTNDILPGADADITVAITVDKDIVAGAGLTGGEDDVLPGADADVTLTTDIPGAYYREYDDKWQYEGTGAADQRYTLQSPARLLVDVDDTMYLISAQTDYDLSVAATWDTTGGTDYTVAANRAGVDFYIYAIQQAGTTPLIEVSSNSSAPDGYTTANSRKIGGFHCLCVAVGAIGGHTLTGFVAGDILPMSVWDYNHRPVSTPEGMVYSEAMDVWVDIYLASGTGGSTVSVNGGTISDSRTWLDFNDDGAAVKKRLLWDMEFQSIAAGSNEETNNAASADPVTTGGNSDTAGRRMISNIGVEDACGAMWQWLLDTSYRYDAGDHTHTTTITHKGSATGSAVYKDAAETNFNAVLGSTADETVNTSNADPEPAWAYYDLPGAKGSFYRQGTYGTVQLLAGGFWNSGAYAGSRARDAVNWRWHTDAGIGGRFASEPR